MALQDSYDGPRTTDDNRNNTSWGGQTFTPSSSYSITSVRLTLSKLNSPGTVTVSIRACTTDVPSTALPTGADLTSGTINGDDLTSTPTLTEIALTPYALSAGTMYAIIIRGTASSTNYVRPAIDGTPTYAGGRYCQSSNSGGSWAAINYDMLFETYGAVTHEISGSVGMVVGQLGGLTGTFLVSGTVPSLFSLTALLSSNIFINGTSAITFGLTAPRLFKLFKVDHTVPLRRLIAAGNNRIFYEVL